MAAAVASRGANTSRPGSSMSSPLDVKRVLPNQEDSNSRGGSAQPDTQLRASSATTKTDSVPAVKAEPYNEPSKPANTVEPLAPPPKPSQANTTAATPDYFSASHANNFHLEPNPFEQSFGNPSAETPGKGLLPSVASLTSPAPLGPNGTPGWHNSLRSGPLSPAMLSGPQNSYFDPDFRGSFPTPNESSLRSGLTPGGGGSMFPAPSPNSQAIFSSMQSGGATPGTIEFHRTAMSAAAKRKTEIPANAHAMANNPSVPQQEYQPTQQAQAQAQYNNQPENDAVNSLFMLAQNRGGNNQFAVPPQPSHVNNTAQMQARPSSSTDNTPAQQRGVKQSVGSIGSMGGMSDGNDYDNSDGSADAKTFGRNKSKRNNSSGKSGQAANNRRKADDTPNKGSANKRTKSNGGSAKNVVDPSIGDYSDDDMDSLKDEDENGNPTGRKMTDEEKRKNFLERNRIAALKCRQRKKQWLANLQTKVEIFTSENDALSQQVGQLKDEIINLKTLLYAHKDCQVSHQQGISGMAMSQLLGGFEPSHSYQNMPQMGQPGGHMVGMHGGQGMHRG